MSNQLDTKIVHTAGDIYVVRAEQGGWSQHGSGESPEEAEDNALRRLMMLRGGTQPKEDIRHRYPAELERTGLTADQVRDIMQREFGKKHSRELSEDQALILYGILRAYPAKEKNKG